MSILERSAQSLSPLLFVLMTACSVETESGTLGEDENVGESRAGLTQSQSCDQALGKLFFSTWALASQRAQGCNSHFGEVWAAYEVNNDLAYHECMLTENPASWARRFGELQDSANESYEACTSRAEIGERCPETFVTTVRQSKACKTNNIVLTTRYCKNAFDYELCDGYYNDSDAASSGSVLFGCNKTNKVTMTQCDWAGSSLHPAR